MPNIAVGAQTLRFEASEGTGPALVFCHSFAMDGSMFTPQLAAFSNTHRCITWDQRGHGGSIAHKPFTFWDSARDAIALLDHLRIDRAVFVGTSQGGFVSLRAALTAPERVAGLMILGSSPFAESLSQKLSFNALRFGLLATRATGLPQFPLKAMKDICFGPRFDDSAWPAKWKAWPTPQFKLAFNALVGRDDISGRLREITAPTLVMHGSADKSYAVPTGRAIADGVADSRGFVVVEGGAHFLSLTDPEPVNTELRSFLARLR